MSNQLSGGRAIGLVARREFMTQISKKSFVISNVIILVAIIGGIIGGLRCARIDDRNDLVNPLRKGIMEHPLLLAPW